MMPKISIAMLSLLMGCMAVPAGPQQLQSPDIWEQVIRAKGGRERLHAIQIMVWSADYPSAESSAVGERLEFVEAMPDRYWSWEDYRPGTMGFRTEVWNAQKKLSWESRRGESAKPLPWSDRAAQARLRDGRERALVFLLETKFTRPVVRELTERPQLIDVDAVAPGFASVRYAIDKATFLPRVITLVPEFTRTGESTPRSAAPERYELSDYHMIDGIQMPRRIDRFGDMHFVFNPDIDPKLFEAPPDGVTSRDAWKKFLRK